MGTFDTTANGAPMQPDALRPRAKRRRPFGKVLVLVAGLFICLSGWVQGQLVGTKTIPGDYPTFMAAVADLNLVGVGPGGVTFNIAPAYTETNVMAVLTMTTNPPTLLNPLKFQRASAGTNPILTAGTGVSTTVDGIVVLNGVDYVTFDGIDLQENAANLTATTQMEWGYALVKASAGNGSQRNTIKNCTVTLNQANAGSVGIYLGNHLAANTTTLTVTSFLGTSSYNKFYNNTVQNCYGGYTFTGFASAAPYDLYDQGNEIGVDGISTRRSQVIQFGGGATNCQGIFGTNQNGMKVFKTYVSNTGAPASTANVSGIFLSTGSNSNADVYNDTLTVISNGTTGLLAPINVTMGGTGAGNTVNIYNNVVTGSTYATATAGEFRGISSTGTASRTNIYNNTVSNCSQAGTSQYSGIYYGGSSATLVLAVNIYNNTVSGNSKSGTAGQFNCVYASSSTAVTNCYNNQFFNNTAAANTSGMYGYYNFAFCIAENIYNNQIYNLTNGSGELIAVNARSGSAPTDKAIYGNVIHDLVGAALVGAIIIDYGTTSNCYKNNIYNLSSSATTLTPGVFGISVGPNVNVYTNVYNNFISDLKAPTSTSLGAVYGIWAQGSASSFINLYHNSMYLTSSSSGTTFGTAGVYMTAVPLSIDLRNNIIVNNSTPGATGGFTVAVQRSAASLTNYALTSGHNALRAGTPAANSLIFYDGTNSDQTLQAFKNRVGPREQASFTEVVPFAGIGAPPYNLHLTTFPNTQCEGGARPISFLTDDYDGNPRSASNPDVGADEALASFNDIASPDIQYTLLGNTGVAANRPLTAFATVTDPSGVNVTVGTKPRIYYKRSTNANTINGNTNATDGWKFVEASNAASPFNFTIDYSLLFGGGVVAGDIIQYFVTAQDLNTIPRIGLNNGGFTVQPSSVALAAANLPLTNTINQFTIVANTYAGTILVGPTETITSLTNAGGAFALLNAGVLSGNVTLSITGDLTAETGTNALNQWTETGVGNYNVTISPSSATVRTISGTHATLSLLRFDGADRATIDGRFAGAGQFLRLRNTSNSAPTVGYINDAQNNGLRNCIIESGNNTTGAASAGAILIGTTTGIQGNDNIFIGFNEIRDRSDIVATPAILINCVGTTTSPTHANSGVVIDNNNFHDWFLLNSGSNFGLFVGTGNTHFSITNNSFYQTTPRAHAVAGAATRAINVSNATASPTIGGMIVTGNYVGGSAPLATGTDMTISSTASHVFIGIFVSTGLAQSSVQGNILRKINYTSPAPAAAATMFAGMNIGQGILDVGTISGNVIGDPASTGSITVTINAGGAVSSFLAGILCASVNGYANIQNNTIAGWNIGGTTVTGAIIPQYIQVQGTPAQNFNISNNLIGSTTVANSINVNAPATPVVAFGLRLLISTGVNVTISGNTVQNITDASTQASSADYGMLLVNTVGASAPLTVTNNTIKDFTANSSPTGASIVTLGLSLQGYAGNTHLISANTIAGIANANTAAGLGYTMGLQTQGANTGGTMSRNKIYDIRNAQSGVGAGLAGIYMSAGNGWTLTNNMVSIANGSGTNGLLVYGIADNCSGSINVWNNSVYLGGTNTGATNSYAYARGTSSIVNLRNNLLYNDRTGGTGFHYAIGNVAAAPAENWSFNSSNYNTFVTRAAARLGEWGAGTGQTIAQWRTSTGSEYESYADTTLNVTAAQLFNNATLGDLTINPANVQSWYVNGKGITGILTGNNADDQGATGVRSTSLGTPNDIGADEFTPNPGVLPIPAIASAAPAVSTTTTYTFANRKLGEIVWGSAGTPPSAIVWSNYSGVPAPGASGSIINSYWDVAATGGSGYTYDIKSYYTNAEQNALSDFQLNQGKKTNGSPWNFIAGTATLVQPAKYYNTTGLNSLSQFTLGYNLTPNYTITASVVSGTGTITPSGAVSVVPLNNQSFVIAAGTCNIIDSVFVDGLYVGAVTSYDFPVVQANHTISVKFKAVTVVPAITITASPNDTICAGTVVTFTATATNPGSAPGYQWKKNGLPVGTSSTTYSDGGLVQGDIITCELTNGDVCASPNLAVSNTITMTVNPITTPSISISAAPGASICIGQSVTFSASAVNGGPTPAYQWLKNGLPVGSSSSTYVDNALVNGDVIQCVLTSSDPCPTSLTSSSNSITITVAPPVTAAPAADPQACGFNVSCAGGNDGVAHANATGGCPSYTYAWSSGGSTDTETGLSAGTYFVTITDGTGASYVDSVTVTEPTALLVSLGTVTPSCANDSTGTADITVSGGSTCSAYTFNWSNGTATEDLANAAPGNYTVTITDAQGCTTTQSVTVPSLAAPSPAFAQAGNLLTSSQPWVTYQWYLNGNPISGATSMTYTITVSGTYALMVTDSNGCSGLTPDSVITGIADQFGIALSIYPNPARGEFKLRTASPIAGAITVNITDMYGHRLAQQVLPELTKDVTFDLKAFAAGTYMVEVVSDLGQRKLFRLAVQ